MINVNSIDKYPVSNSGLNQEDIQATMTKGTQAVTDSFENNSAGKVMMGNTQDPNNMLNTLLLLPFLCEGDKLLNKAIAGKGGDGALGKIAAAGDKLVETLHLDKVFSPKNENKISSFIKNNRFLKYFTNDYKAIAKNSMGKSQTMSEKYSQELFSKLSELKYNFNASNTLNNSLSKETKKLFENVGPIKSAINNDYLTSLSNTLKEIYPRAINDADRTSIMQLGKKIDDFIKSGNTSTNELANDIASVLSRFKSKDYQSLSLMSKKPLSSGSLKILDSVSTGSSKVQETIAPEKLIKAADEFISGGVNSVEKKGLLSKSSVSISELKNKLKASGKQMGKTTMGQTMAKGTLKAKDLFTFGGGLMGLAFTANAVIQAVKATKEAPKGEKKSTFMHVLSENYIGIALFQPSINLLYKLGGNKYRGMTKEGRDALKDLVTKTNADKAITNEGLKVAKLQSKLLLKGVDKNKVSDLAGKSLKEAKSLAKSLGKEGAKLKWWEKPLKFAGKILDTGLDTIKKDKHIGKIKLPTLKGFAGGLGRFAIIMLVLQPLLQKPVTKLCHKIFGEPKTYLAKQKAKEEASKSNPPTSDNNIENNETNILKRYTQNYGNNTLNNNSNDTSYSANTPSDNSDTMSKNDEIAALNLFNKKSERYIPKTDNVVNYDLETEKAIQKEVDEFLKGSKELEKRVKNHLK